MDRYTAVLTANWRTILVIERSVEGDERMLSLYIDDGPPSEVRFLTYYLPGYTFSPSSLAIWGGKRLYLLPLADGASTRIDYDDEIHRVYPLGERRLLVGESSLALVDTIVGRVVDQYLHDEVLTHSRWLEDRLMKVASDTSKRR